MVSIVNLGFWRLFPILLILQLSLEASSPIVWVASDYFRAGTSTFMGFTNSGTDQNITVTYSTPLSGPPDQGVALGIVDFQFNLPDKYFQFTLLSPLQTQTNFIANFVSLYASNIAKVRFHYLTVDPSFPYPFSVTYFQATQSPALIGPFSTNVQINFTASTGVIVDLTHDNGMIAFQHLFDAQSSTSCFQMELTFFMKNQSYYQATMRTTCNMKVWLWGYSRMIFDKTAIQSLGQCFFNYGTIQAVNSDASTLTQSFLHFQPSNFMLGMNSFSFRNQNPFQFQSTIASTTSVSSTMNFVHLKFMYWAFRFRTCLASYPYFNLDKMLCYDACEVRYYQDQSKKTCDPCYYTCYTCSPAFTENCLSCSAQLDFRYISGSSCLPLSGYFDNLTTVAVPCVSNCIQCSDEFTCITCSSPDFIVGSNGLCQCVTPGLLCVCDPEDINCATCSNPRICQICNSGYTQISGNCQKCSDPFCKNCITITQCAECLQGYADINGICTKQSIVCSDYFISLTQQCDDGNQIQRDGCSLECKVQTDFVCENQNPNGPSLCYFTGSFELTKVYTKKISNQNKVQILYNISNSDLAAFSQANLQKMIQISDNSGQNKIKNYSIVALPNGQLKVIIDYVGDLQNDEIVVSIDPTLSQNWSLLRAQSTQKSETILPDNNQGAYFYEDSIYQSANVLSSLSLAISVLSLIGYFLGMFGAKMIGVEMMAVVQVSFLGLITLLEHNPAFSALSNLWLVNGYNQINTSVYLEDPYTTAQPKGILLYSRFVQNYNYTYLLIGVPLSVGLVIYIYYYLTYKRNQPDKVYKLVDQQDASKNRLKTIWQKSIGEYAFSGVMFCSYIVSTSSAVQFIFGINRTDAQLGIISIIGCILMLLFYAGYFVFLWLRPKYFGQFHYQFKQESDSITRHYYHVMMLERLIVGFALALTLDFPFEAIIPLIIFMFIGIFVIIRKPYIKPYNNYRVIANMAVSIFSMSVYLFYRNTTAEVRHKEQISFILPYILCVLLIIVIIYNVVAIVYTIIQNWKKKKSAQQQKEEIANFKNIHHQGLLQSLRVSISALDTNQQVSQLKSFSIPRLSPLSKRSSPKQSILQFNAANNLETNFMREYDAI